MACLRVVYFVDLWVGIKHKTRLYFNFLIRKIMHPINYLINHIEQTVNLDKKDYPLIKRHFELRELEKKEILLFKGDVSRHMRFIEDGCLKCYHIDGNGDEQILQFGIEGWWINDLYSYLTQSPAQYFIQAIEDSRVLQIRRRSLEQPFEEVPAIERFFRIKIQNAYVSLQDRTIHRMHKSAKQRYIDFRQSHSNIEQRVPQYKL